jgi:hypothetical protein
MYNDPGSDQPVSALENANGFHIELNENALEHVSRFYQPSVNTGSPTVFEYPLSSPFWLRVQCNGYSMVCGAVKLKEPPRLFPPIDRSIDVMFVRG